MNHMQQAPMPPQPGFPMPQFDVGGREDHFHPGGGGGFDHLPIPRGVNKKANANKNIPANGIPTSLPNGLLNNNSSNAATKSKENESVDIQCEGFMLARAESPVGRKQTWSRVTMTKQPFDTSQLMRMSKKVQQDTGAGPIATFNSLGREQQGVINRLIDTKELEEKNKLAEWRLHCVRKYYEKDSRTSSWSGNRRELAKILVILRRQPKIGAARGQFSTTSGGSNSFDSNIIDLSLPLPVPKTTTAAPKPNGIGSSGPAGLGLGPGLDNGIGALPGNGPQFGGLLDNLPNGLPSGLPAGLPGSVPVVKKGGKKKNMQQTGQYPDNEFIDIVEDHSGPGRMGPGPNIKDPDPFAGLGIGPPLPLPLPPHGPMPPPQPQHPPPGAVHISDYQSRPDPPLDPFPRRSPPQHAPLHPHQQPRPPTPHEGNPFTPDPQFNIPGAFDFPPTMNDPRFRRSPDIPRSRSRSLSADRRHELKMESRRLERKVGNIIDDKLDDKLNRLDDVVEKVRDWNMHDTTSSKDSYSRRGGSDVWSSPRSGGSSGGGTPPSSPPLSQFLPEGLKRKTSRRHRHGSGGEREYVDEDPYHRDRYEREREREPQRDCDRIAPHQITEPFEDLPIRRSSRHRRIAHNDTRGRSVAYGISPPRDEDLYRTDSHRHRHHRPLLSHSNTFANDHPSAHMRRDRIQRTLTQYPETDFDVADILRIGGDQRGGGGRRRHRRHDSAVQDDGYDFAERRPRGLGRGERDMFYDEQPY